MSTAYFISDTHFGHKNIVTFKDNDGKPLRPFSTVEEMDEAMVENWNKIVGMKDRVYHLGDVVINRKALPIMDRLNGRKCLVKGNHDIFKLSDYLPYFDDIRSYKVFPEHGIICSHIPVHPCQLESRFKFNVHGHLHSNHVMIPDWDGNSVRDKRYINICVEHTNYTPISFEEVLKKCVVSS